MQRKENSCLALQQVHKMSRKCHISHTVSRYNESIMKYDSPEHQVAKHEIRDKTLWSYFWAATAGVTMIASLLMGFHMLAGIESTIGTAVTALGGLGAAVQSFSYDRESAALHDKLEIALAKGAEPDAKQLGGAIKELSHEIHAMREQEIDTPKRSDNLLWTQFIEQQRAAPQPEVTPTPHPSS